ncbi:MAG: HEAT repeat domain-containing protein, partial [Rubripirellula sp.]
ESREQQFRSRDFGRGLEALAHTARNDDDKTGTREFLSGYLNHAKSTISAQAASSLGVLGDPKAAAVLEAYRDSNDDRVKRAAEQAITKLREVKPTAPKEIIDLRKEMADVKKESEKLKKDLDDLRAQVKAKESSD